MVSLDENNCKQINKTRNPLILKLTIKFHIDQNLTFIWWLLSIRSEKLPHIIPRKTVRLFLLPKHKWTYRLIHGLEKESKLKEIELYTRVNEHIVQTFWFISGIVIPSGQFMVGDFVIVEILKQPHLGRFLHHKLWQVYRYDHWVLRI